MAQTKDRLNPARGLGWKPIMRVGISLSLVWVNPDQLGGEGFYFNRMYLIEINFYLPLFAN